MKNLYLLALAATLVLAGCKKDDPDFPPPHRSLNLNLN